MSPANDLPLLSSFFSFPTFSSVKRGSSSRTTFFASPVLFCVYLSCPKQERKYTRREDQTAKEEEQQRSGEIAKSRVTRRSHRGGDPSTPPPLDRERGYFTASPRQDRMTYFDRLLLSRGASSATLISNRKSRGAPRQQPANPRRPSSFFIGCFAKKDRQPIPLLLPRHLHILCKNGRLLFL